MRVLGSTFSCDALLRFGYQSDAEFMEWVGEQSHSLNSPTRFCVEVVLFLP